MASAAAASPATPNTGGPLSFMGCMREASSPPRFDDATLNKHTQNNHHNRPIGLPTGSEYAQVGGHPFDSMPKEPKKRRFHPLRGLRRIFRKKSRGAADCRQSSSSGERETNGDLITIRDREEVTLRDPSGRQDEIRSRSASELLTETSDRDRLFARRRGLEETFTQLQRNGPVGQLSVSHDSVFPGEVSHNVRPLSSSLDMHASLERRNIKTSNDLDHKDVLSQQKHRISLRVLEQIKTVIENRNQIAAAGSANSALSENVNLLNNRFSRDRSERSTSEDIQAKIPKKDVSSSANNSINEEPTPPHKDDLPELPTVTLNHTAALHRISVRPKNRRPPRRSTSTSTSTQSPTSNGLPRIDSISENSIDTLDSLETTPTDDALSTTMPTTPEALPPTVPTTPTTPTTAQTKPIPILRKSSSRLSRNSEVFEELEQKLPSLRNKPACSPDSLESNLDSRSSADILDDVKPPRPTPRSASTGSDKSPRRSSVNRLSKSPDSLENSSPGWLVKSSEGLFELDKDVVKPVPARRSLISPIPVSKSQERVCCKSSDSLEALEALNSDDSMERRRSSFDIRPRRSKVISKSTECFESSLSEQQQQQTVKAEEKRKRASVSEVNLSRGSRFVTRPLSESFEKLTNFTETEKSNVWRIQNNRRIAHSSESSDNLELDDNCKLENRRRSTPKRLSRLQKNSESSELGSTDTLDSERRNTMKSSDSDETLDSLEKDLQEQHNERSKDEEINNVNFKEEDEASETKIGAFWRRRTNSQESKEDKNNLDIHQLYAYSIVSKIHENGNNDKHDETVTPLYSKKKPFQTQQQQSSSEEQSRNNQLVNKTDEEVQNMLNGNISEVSTDTKSFKEKLIMFEKLGK